MLKHGYEYGYHNGYSGTGTNFGTWVRVLHLWERHSDYANQQKAGELAHVKQEDSQCAKNGSPSDYANQKKAGELAQVKHEDSQCTENGSYWLSGQGWGYAVHI